MRTVLRTGLAAALLAAAATEAGRVKLYVSTRGRDTWSGRSGKPNWRRSDGPFASLERACDEVMALRARGPRRTDDIDVIVREGTYQLHRPMALNGADWDPAAGRVRVRPYSGERVTVRGGTALWDWETVPDDAASERLPAASRPHVLVTDLRAQGIEEFGAPDAGGMEIFCNGRAMALARYPNQGFVTITGLLGGEPVDVRGTKGDRIGRFTYGDERLDAWADEPDARVHGYWFWDWADQRHRIRTLHPDRNEIDLHPPYHGYGYRVGQWFYGVNLLCELDEPGEWYVDRDTGRLYLWPPEPVGRDAVQGSVVPRLLELTACHSILWEGMTLELCRGDAIRISDSRDVVLSGCTIRNAGGWAVIVAGGSGNTVRCCDISGIGGGGVALRGGDRRTLQPAGHRADNNHIHHYARVSRMYRPGISLQGVGNEATHNLIHHAPHQAIAFGGNDHRIASNEIHSVCLESNDAGAIYAGRDWTARGTVIEHNHLHHITGYRHKACMGVYLDDMYSGTTIRGNLFYRVRRAAFIGGGRDNTIDNNIFVECEPAVHVDARGTGWAHAAVPGVLTQRLKAMPYLQPLWRQRYPSLPGILEDEPALPKGNRVTRNISWHGGWTHIHPAARPHVHMADNLVDDDPKFVNPDAAFFALLGNSPAFALGFEALPVRHIGLYKDRDRPTWPVEHAPAHPDVSPVPGRRAWDRPPPGHQVNRVRRGSVTVDGRVGADEWPDSPTTAIVCETPAQGCRASEHTAEAWAQFDGSDLLLLIVVPVAPGLPLATDGPWGQVDAVEIAFQHAGNRNGPILNLRGFPTGRATSVTDAGAPADLAAALGQALTHAATRQPDRWISEWRIPLRAAGMIPEQMRELRANLNVRRMADESWTVWADTGGPIWDVPRGGVLVFP